MTRCQAVLAMLVCLGCGPEGWTQGHPGDSADDFSIEHGPASDNRHPAVDPNTGEPSNPAGEPVAEICVPGHHCGGMPVLANALHYPVVLVHGMGGFKKSGFMTYFNGVQKALRSSGYAVYTAKLDPMNGSDVRGTQLAEYVDRVLACTCAAKVNIIGHSQGGIDARYVVNVLKYGDRVASVSTVATPHHGTRLADLFLNSIKGPWWLPGAKEDIADFFAWMLGSLYTDSKKDPSTRAAMTWCSTAHQKQFGKDYPPDPNVSWYSYAGRAGLTARGKPECESADMPNPKAKVPMHPNMLAGWLFLGGLKGVDNDGLVTVNSSKYGHFRGCVAADHLHEVGLFVAMPFLFDHKKFYSKMVKFLVSQGH